MFNATAIIALLISPSVLAADKKVGYKCYLDTSAGKQVVLFSWKKSKVNSRLFNLPASRVTVANGKRAFVKDIIECVPENKRFKTPKAQEKDRLQLR